MPEFSFEYQPRGEQQKNVISKETVSLFRRQGCLEL